MQDTSNGSEATADRSKLRRVEILDGELVLLAERLPDLPCQMISIDEEGCLAKAVPGPITMELAAAWQTTLTPSQQVRIRVECLTPAIAFEVNGVVLKLSEFPTHIEFELRFLKLGPQQRAAIEHARFTSALQNFDLPPAPTQVSKTQAEEHQVNNTPLPTLFLSAAELGHAPQITSPDSQLHKRMHTKTLSEILVCQALLSQAQAEAAATSARKSGESLAHFLVRNKHTSPQLVCHALALQSGLAMVDLSSAEIGCELSSLFTFATITKHQFVPFAENAAFVSIAVAEPLKNRVVKELEYCIDKPLRQFLASEDVILSLLNRIQEYRKPRRHARFPASLQARYQFCNRMGTPTDDTIYFVRTMNISEGGLAVEGVPSLFNNRPDVHRNDVYVNLSTATSWGSLQAACQLRWIRREERKAADTPKWLMGLQIVGLSSEDQERLKSLCAQIALTGSSAP
jgi:hypothetical protein